MGTQHSTQQWRSGGSLESERISTTLPLVLAWESVTRKIVVVIWSKLSHPLCFSVSGLLREDGVLRLLTLLRLSVQPQMQHSRSVRLVSSCASFNLIDNHISHHHYHTTPHDIPCSSFIPSRPVFPSNPGVPVHSPIPVTKEAGIFRMLSSQERMTADELFQYRFILRLFCGKR